MKSISLQQTKVGNILFSFADQHILFLSYPYIYTSLFDKLQFLEILQDVPLLGSVSCRQSNDQQTHSTHYLRCLCSEIKAHDYTV